MRNIIFRGAALAASLFLCMGIKAKAAGYTEIGQYGRPGCLVYETNDSDEQIAEEIYLGELEELAQLVEAEAGNQDFEGKCLVVDCVLNRVESPAFPDNIHDVIFQDGQFSVINNGAFERAAWTMKEDDFAAVAVEVELHTNREVLYFNNSSSVSGSGEIFKVGDHWFRGGACLESSDTEDMYG